MTELERLLSQDNCCLVSVASIKKALEQEPCEDAISRDDALKALDYDIKSFEFKSGVSRRMNEIANLLNTIYEIQSDNIKALPPVQPKYNTSEWCHDCKEYDKEKHCCPRYNGVIRKAVEEIKQQKTGHWIFDEILDRNYYCSECKSMGVDYWDYCPNCGCRMVEPQESEET